MRMADIQQLVDEAIEESGIPRMVVALTHKMAQAREKLAEIERFHENVAWLEDQDEEDEEPSNNNSKGTNMGPVKKYNFTVKGGSSGSTSTTGTRNPIPGVTGPATGPGAPRLAYQNSNPARVREILAAEDAGRKQRKMPSIAEEQAILAGALEALRLPDSWDQFRTKTKARLAKYLNLPSTLHQFR